MTPTVSARPTHLVGRADELSRLDAFIDSIADGPSALVLEGESGIGKTALWKTGAATAARRGWRVLSTRPTEAEATLSFAGLADLLDGARDAFEALPAPQLGALDVALLRATPVGPPPDARAVCAAVLTVLREAAARGPMLIALDDVQWLDPSTASALEFMVRRVDDEPIGLLVAVRASGSTLPLGISRGFPEERVARLSVQPLSVDDLSALVREHLGAGLPHPAFERLHEMSGGNPFYALEIARATMRGDERATGQAFPIPRSLRDDLVRDRLSALPSLVRELLLYASACSRPTLEILETAIGRSPLAPQLAKAADAGIVDVDHGAISFTHPLYRSAIYAEGSRVHRHEVHRRLSEAVSDGEERARHRALAADGPDEAAARSLEVAAAAALARGSPSAAADLCDLAERLTPPDRTDDVRRLRTAAADHHLLAGDHETAIRLLGPLTSTASPGLERAEALLSLARALMAGDDLRGAADALADAIREDGVPPVILSSIHRWRSSVVSLLGDLDAAERDATAALRFAEAAHDTPSVADALTAVITARTWRGRGVDPELTERALALEATFDPASVARRPSFGLARLLARTGEIDEGRRLSDALLVEALANGDEDSAGTLHRWLGWIDLLAGDWASSMVHVTKAIDLSSGLAGGLGARALLEAYLGRDEATRVDARVALEAAQESGAVDVQLTALSALGLLELSLGNPAGAHEHLGRAWQLHRECRFGEPMMFPFVADHVETLIELGNRDAATEVVEWLEERGSALDRTWARAVAARYRALLAVAEGDFPTAFAALERALEEHERLTMPFELGRTLVVMGTIRRRAKQKRPAREALGGAFEIFERLGARLWAERARTELSRIGGRRAVQGELTAAERRVAKLAAAGRTNREIADTLFMSVRTVEGHLSHVYGKLGIRSRTELALFIEEGEDTTPL